MSAPQYSDDFGHRSEKPGISGCAKVAIGCGIISFVALIVVGIGLWWVAANFREIGADLTSEAMKKGIEELKLPAEQQQRIFVRIDKVVQQFKDKEITLDQVAEIFKEISEGPLLPAGMALVVDRAYLDESGFDEEEKAAARVVIQRFTHGTIRKMIPEAKVDAVLDTISTKKEGGEREFRHPVSDEELRKFIAAAKEASDEANVPEEVPKVNFADEFDKAIDAALGKHDPAEPKS